MRRRYLVPLAALGALLALPGSALGATADLQQALDGKLGDSVGINIVVGDRCRVLRSLHAGRVRVPGDRLLEGEERGHGDREDPDQLLDRRPLLVGGRVRARVQRPAGRLRRARGRLLPHRSRPARRQGRWPGAVSAGLPGDGTLRRDHRLEVHASSSRSARSRWRSSGARPWSGSSSGPTSSTRSSSRASSTRSAPTGCSVADSCRSATGSAPESSGCRTSPARRRCT